MTAASVVGFYFYLFLYLMLFSLFSFEDPGPHGNGRYSEHMLPEIEKKDFRKGAQVFFIMLLLQM